MFLIRWVSDVSLVHLKIGVSKVLKIGGLAKTYIVGSKSGIDHPRF